jgi:hypothetical protein
MSRNLILGETRHQFRWNLTLFTPSHGALVAPLVEGLNIGQDWLTFFDKLVNIVYISRGQEPLLPYTLFDHLRSGQP